MLALHLLKWVTFLRETKGRDIDLRYARTVRGEEIDFVVTEDGAPVLAIECKLSRTPHTPFVKTFAARFHKTRILQVTQEDAGARMSADGIETVSARQFLKELI